MIHVISTLILGNFMVSIIAIQRIPISITHFESIFHVSRCSCALNHDLGLSVCMQHLRLSNIGLIIFLQKTTSLKNYSYVLSSWIVRKILVIFNTSIFFSQHLISYPVLSTLHHISSLSFTLRFLLPFSFRYSDFIILDLVYINSVQTFLQKNFPCELLLNWFS